MTTATAGAAIPTSTLAPTAVPAPRSKWRFENDPRVRGIVMTIPGRLGLLVIFAGLMAVTRVPAWWQTAILLTLTSVVPQWRRPLITLGAICWIMFLPPLLNAPAQPNLLTEIAQQRGAAEWLRFWPVMLIALGLYMLYLRLTGNSSEVDRDK